MPARHWAKVAAHWLTICELHQGVARLLSAATSILNDNENNYYRGARLLAQQTQSAVRHCGAGLLAQQTQSAVRGGGA